VTGYGCSSIEEMAEKIRYIYENQDEWEKMSRNAIDIAKNYTWEKVAGDYEKFLLSLIGGKN
jgi:glycosyltransferase involved in cell wall biosynthesis